MIIAVLVVLGLCLGSFVNALVWRVHKQAKAHAGNKKNLSIVNGRSVCTHCGHVLAWYDLIPVLSWLSLKGKCRYCRKAIAWQYPLVELCTAGLFVASYVFWPSQLEGVGGQLAFALWLPILTGFVALLVYDLKWMLLPNRIIYPLIGLACIFAVIQLLADPTIVHFYSLVLGTVIGGGLFLVLFQISDGRWIGGGDVKFGVLAGLLLADPYLAFLMLFLASLLGTVMVLPGLVAKRVSATSRIPFGPFLIVATIVIMLFGASVVEWYKNTLMVY